MGVDVLTVIEIDRLRAEVAAFACDPDNATAWYQSCAATWTRSQLTSPMSFARSCLNSPRLYGNQ